MKGVLCAHAEEQADMEWRIHVSWANKWAHARELVQPILKAALGEVPVGLEVTEGSMDIIELEIEEDYDRHRGDSDFEE